MNRRPKISFLVLEDRAYGGEGEIEKRRKEEEEGRKEEEDKKKIRYEIDIG